MPSKPLSSSSSSKAATASASSSSSSSLMMRFEDGAVQFRQRIVCSLLSHRPILIRNIRADHVTAPGLRPYEANFLRLIDRLTNGTRIEINNTGTQLRFVPGILTGGNIQHDCPVGSEEKQQKTTRNPGDEGAADDDDDEDNMSYRSIGWYLEGIWPLAPFGKDHLVLELTGITDGCSDVDPSVDYWAASAMPLLSHFGVGGSSKTKKAEKDFLDHAPASLRVLQRGAAPAGGGRVRFYCPMVVQTLQPIDFIEPGLVKRVRGRSISCKLVSSSTAARAAFAAKGLLHRLLPDVWIHTDVHSPVKSATGSGAGGCGPSPGLSVVLSAETTTGVVYTAETCWSTHHQRRRELPETVGQVAAAQLLEEIRRGGCIDTGMQSWVLLWMCLTPEDVSRIRIGTLSQYTMESLRLFKTAFGVEFKVKADPDTKTVLLSCLGTGYQNMARART